MTEVALLFAILLLVPAAVIALDALVERRK